MFGWLKSVFSVERELEVKALAEQNANKLSFDEWARVERGEITEAEILASKMPEPTQAPTHVPTQTNKDKDIVKDESEKQKASASSVILGLFLFLWLVSFLFDDSDKTSSSSSSRSPTFNVGEKRTILGDGRLGCKVQSDIESLQKYINQGDKVAAEKLGIAGVLSGQCIVFKNFDAVIIEEYSVWSDMVKVRKIGDIAEYWVMSNAIRPKL